MNASCIVCSTVTVLRDHSPCDISIQPLPYHLRNWHIGQIIRAWHGSKWGCLTGMKFYGLLKHTPQSSKVSRVMERFAGESQGFSVMTCKFYRVMDELRFIKEWVCIDLIDCSEYVTSLHFNYDVRLVDTYMPI